MCQIRKAETINTLSNSHNNKSTQSETPTSKHCVQSNVTYTRENAIDASVIIQYKLSMDSFIHVHVMLLCTMFLHGYMAGLLYLTLSIYMYTVHASNHKNIVLLRSQWSKTR